MTNPSHPQSPTPSESLRDARLAQALQHMPDAHMQPSAQTRHAVLQEALRAAMNATPAAPTSPPAAKNRWWHAWLGQPGQRVPWNAALASIAVVGFVTVLWHGKDVPDAAPERSAEARRKAEADVSTDTAIVPNAKVAADTALARSTGPSKERAAPATASANMASPAPAPATPQSYSSPSQRSVAGGSERSEATAIAKLSAGPTVTIAQSDVTHSVPPEKAQALLNFLRGLTYGPESVLPKRVESDASFADLVVELAGQERWVIASDKVLYQPLTTRVKGAIASAKAGAGAGAGASDGVLSSDITPAQYAAVRRLATELGL